jgi:hypothetical protein
MIATRSCVTPGMSQASSCFILFLHFIYTILPCARIQSARQSHHNKSSIAQKLEPVKVHFVELYAARCHLFPLHPADHVRATTLRHRRVRQRHNVSQMPAWYRPPRRTRRRAATRCTGQRTGLYSTSARAYGESGSAARAAPVTFLALVHSGHSNVRMSRRRGRRRHASSRREYDTACAQYFTSMWIHVEWSTRTDGPRGRS